MSIAVVPELGVGSSSGDEESFHKVLRERDELRQVNYTHVLFLVMYALFFHQV